MLLQAWVNGIAIAVVAAILINAWLALRARAKHSTKPKEVPSPVSIQKTPRSRTRVASNKDERRWALLRNEAEIARRRAR